MIENHRAVRAASTDGNQGNPLILVVTGDSHGFRVEGHLPVGNIDVAMVAVAQIHAECPVTVGPPLHGIRVRVPVIEITYDADMPGLGRGADKIVGANVMRAVLTLGCAAHGIR